MRGWIDTQPGQAFHGQVLAGDAPKQFTLEQIYSDEVLAASLTQGIAGSALQLLLLLDKDPLVEIQENAQRPVLLEPEAIPRCRVPAGMSAQVHIFEPREGGRFRVSLSYHADGETGKTSGRTARPLKRRPLRRNSIRG